MSSCAYNITTSLIILLSCFFFFFNHTATTETYTLSLHDALPISFLIMTFVRGATLDERLRAAEPTTTDAILRTVRDRKSTRLNSSHSSISYAVFCLKKKKKKKHT